MVISCFDTEWKKYYRCDLEGNVYRLAGTTKQNVDGDRLLKQYTTKRGYRNINLHYNEKNKVCRVNRLVAMYFINNFENKSTVEHKNHNKSDNRLVNLCWFSPSEQQEYRVGNCNKKNIYKRPDGGWRIAITRYGKDYRTHLPKTKTLNDAILLRDKMLSMF